VATLETAPTSTAPAMRSDARRNREKLLRAAGEQFAAAGPEVALEAIARAAGVGIGTLYRHFPTRDALVEAAYLDEVERLCATAEDLLAEDPPDEALAKWMDRFVCYAIRKRGLSEALKSIAAVDSELVPNARAQLLASIARFLDAGQGDGLIRVDVEPEDVLRAMSAAWALPQDKDWAAHARRLLQLLIDGLRFGA
jgi:AcrR family transcriptional regulator